MARKMKDSGINWIGEIPENWTLLPLGNCFKERNEKVSDYVWEPLSVTKQGILKQLETAAKSDAHDSRKKVCKNDFVINSRSDRKQSCGISPYNGSVSLINIVLENRVLDTGYVKYLLKNYGFAEEFYRWGTGIVADLWSTKYERMKKIMLPIPSEIEQQKIANYLDEKIKEIDCSVEKTKETIEDYKKYKQAIITEAVTKGLNPNVVMKDSGIEWVGEIPEKWEKIKLKNKIYVRARLGWKGLKAEEYVDEGYPFLSAFNIINNKLNFNETNFINEFRYEESPEIKLTVGDILLVKDGAGIGKCAIVEDLPRPSTVNGSIAVLTCDSTLNSKYLYYYFLSKLFQKYIDRLKDGMGVPHLFQRDIKMILIPLPSKNEQDEIANYLDEKCREIDNLITKKEILVEELEAYKKSLIYEYVTGKKKVPESKIIPFPATVNCKDKRFAQAVLLTKILDEFGEYHSGRVKVAKTLYVIENHIGFDFDTDTVRKVAGPLDEKFYKAEAVVRHNKWFNVLEQNGATRYFAGKDKQKYLEYYNRYFKDYDAEIQRIINIFKGLNMNEAELLATAYASWNDAIIKGNGFSKDDLVDDIFSWDDSKKRFPKEKWLQTFEELKQKNIVPVGHGKMTIIEKE